MSSLALTGSEPPLDRCLHGVSGLRGFPPDGELSQDPLLCDIGHRWQYMSSLGVFLSWAGVLECWDTRELLALLEKVPLGWIYYTIKLSWGVTTRRPPWVDHTSEITVPSVTPSSHHATIPRDQVHIPINRYPDRQTAGSVVQTPWQGIHRLEGLCAEPLASTCPFILCPPKGTHIHSAPHVLLPRRGLGAQQAGQVPSVACRALVCHFCHVDSRVQL